jgi:dTDP-4-amino-4,6-dideoxygalactose transaminase
LVINNRDYIERAEIISEKGTNRSKFFRGEVDKYTWVDIGSSFLLADILAAYLYPQLKLLNYITKLRRHVWHTYYSLLIRAEKKGFIQLPCIPKAATSSYHNFYFILNNKQTMIHLMNYLHNHKIEAFFHYLPLHTSSMGRRYKYHVGDFPITEKIGSRLLRLPMHAYLTKEEQKKVADAIYEYFK